MRGMCVVLAASWMASVSAAWGAGGGRGGGGGDTGEEVAVSGASSA